MKKVLASWLLVLMLAAACFPALAEEPVSPKGEFPIAKEPITLRIWCNLQPNMADNIETNDGTVYLQEKTGINIQWEKVGINEAKEKLRVIMAANTDLPDIILLSNSGAIITTEQVFSYGMQGLLLPLNDLITEYGDAIYEAYALDKAKERAITAPDGKIYGLPATSDGAYHMTANQKFYINKAWLDKLGLTMPATLDEFHNVLVAFRDKDPNGNGIKDEVPLSGTVGSMWTRGTLDCFLMNAFQYSTSYEKYWLYRDDSDQVAFGATTDGYREGLRFFRKLYEEGLMDKEIFINTNDSLKLLTGAGDGNKLGSFVSMFAVAAASTDNPEFFDYVALPPLEGPAGRIAPDTTSGGAGFRYLITSSCKYPEAAYRLGDYLMTVATRNKETFEDMTVRYGKEGVSWERAQPGDIGIDGGPALFRKLPDEVNGIKTANWGDLGPMTFPAYERNGAAIADPNAYNIEKVLYEETKTCYEPYRVNRTVPYMNFSPEDTEVLTDIRINIQNYGQEALAAFVTGEMDIEKDWDTYVQNMRDLGLDTLVELTNKTYQAWKND